MWDRGFSRDNSRKDVEEGMIERVFAGGDLLGLIVPGSFRRKGIHFFTPEELSQQLAQINYPTGKVIEPHVHNLIPRNIKYTQEVLVIRKGKLRVDFYDKNRDYVESRILNAGDIILLVDGGHSFEVLEEVEMIEVKQGPYVGDADKSRFEGIDPDRIVIKG
jgi:mannose-6-phosphate isomerase-like protein (cupin superfamily)